MVHVLEHPELPVGTLGVDGRLEGAGNLLDGHLQVGAVRQPGLLVHAKRTYRELRMLKHMNHENVSISIINIKCNNKFMLS